MERLTPALLRLLRETCAKVKRQERLVAKAKAQRARYRALKAKRARETAAIRFSLSDGPRLVDPVVQVDPLTAYFERKARTTILRALAARAMSLARTDMVRLMKTRGEALKAIPPVKLNQRPSVPRLILRRPPAMRLPHRQMKTVMVTDTIYKSVTGREALVSAVVEAMADMGMRYARTPSHLKMLEEMPIDRLSAMWDGVRAYAERRRRVILEGAEDSPRVALKTTVPAGAGNGATPSPSATLIPLEGIAGRQAGGWLEPSSDGSPSAVRVRCPPPLSTRLEPDASEPTRIVLPVELEGAECRLESASKTVVPG